MNPPYISMKRGLLSKNHPGDRRATAVLRYAIIMILISAQLFGLGMSQGLANGPIPRPGGAASPGQPPQVGGVPPSAQAGLVSLNFTGADLVEVIHVLAQYLKLNYTIDPGVRGTVTLYSAQPLRQQDLLPVFHQVLRMNDAVAVKSGQFYHIAPINVGKGMVRPARRLGERGYILQVVPVRFFSVSEIKRLLEPFMTPGGEILEYPRGNFLIILDLAINIQRLLEIKDLIDINVFAGVRMELYQPQVASAEELADEMDRIMQAYAASATQSENFVARFIPVPRINRLLVISHSEAAWTYAMRWLERIDTYAEGPGRRIFVYAVENGKAIDLADILNQVLGQGSTGSIVPRKTLRDVAERIAGGQQQTPSSGLSAAGQTGTGTVQSGSLYAVAPAQAPSPQGRPRAGAGAAPTSAGGGGVAELVRIVPDPATNSLIIFGTAQEFQNIRNILKEIDIVPRQVLMDVMIAEVTLTDDLRFGVEYQMLRDPDVEIFGRDFDQHVSILSGLPGALLGGAGPQALSMIIGTGDDIRGFINARREDSRVKVLSSPTILATDNQPARIQVGTEEPIATGTVTSPVSTGVTSSTTIQYRNTGRILTIIPQVNAQGLVHLQVKTEVSQRGASVTVGQDSFPSFDTRDAETTAVVQDGETLAIGGIITERVTRGRVGVPFLMDIPVFGRFFGTTTDDVDRTELIILITPHVIRNKEEARTITEEFKSILGHVIQEYGWEINNLGRQKSRGLEPVPEKAPTVEPQSSIAPQQQEPQKNARRATIVVPSNPQAYKSLTSSLASSAPASKPNVPGREVRAPAGSSQQSQVVELGNSSIGKGLELAMETQHSDQSNTPTAKAEIPYLKADLTPSGEDQIALLEKASTELSDESLTQLRESLSKTQAQLGTNFTKDFADSVEISEAMEQIPTSMSDFSATVKIPSVGRRASTTESENNFNDELLSAVIRDLEEKQRSVYRTKETKTRTEQVEPPMTSIQEGQKEPEQSERVSSAWQQVVSSFVDSSLPGNRPTAEPIPLDAAAGEKVSLSTPEPNEPSLIDRESTSLVEEGPVPVETDPIAKDLLKETSKKEKKAGRNETGKTGKFETTDATKGVVRDEDQKKAPAPRAAIPSVQELKATLDRMARAARTSDKPSSRSKATDWGIEAKAPGQVVEDTKPSSQKRRAAPSVNRVPVPEQTASIKTEDLSNAKRAMEEKEKVKTVKNVIESATPAKKGKIESPPQKSESSAKEELTKSQAKQKVPVKTEATTVASTTKKQSVKAAETMGQDKEKKADARKKTARKPMAEAEPKPKEIASKNPASEAARKPTKTARTKVKTAVESPKPSVLVKESAPEVVADDSVKVAEASSQKQTSWSPLSWFARSKPGKSSPDETKSRTVNPEEKIKVELKKSSGNKSIPSGAGEKSHVPNVEVASAADEKNSPSARTRWSPLGWFSSSQPVTPGSKETQTNSDEPRKVTKIDSDESANDNFIPSKTAGSSTSVEEKVPSLVRDKVPAPEAAPNTGSRVSAESKGPGEAQKELPVKEPTSKAIASSSAAQESVPEDMKKNQTAMKDKVLPEKRSWSLLDLFQSSQLETSTLKEPQESPEKPEEVAKSEINEISNQDFVPTEATEATSPGEELTQPSLREVPLPRDAESVTIVSIDREQFSESVKERQGNEPVETIIDVPEKDPSENLVRGGASETSIQVESPKVPVITNEVLEAYNQEVAPVTDSLVPTETATLEAEIAGPSVPADSSPSKKTRWSPLGWWSQTETVPSDQDKIAVSPEEPIETAQGQQSAVETLSQEPGPVSPEELPVMEELTSTGGGRTKSQSNSSWSPLSWRIAPCII